MHCGANNFRSLLLRVAVLGFVALAPCANATVYYVDQAVGNDSNIGTTELLPWKNSPGMDSYSGRGSLVAGDTVYFNSARTWVVTGTQGLYLTGGVAYIGNSWGTGTRATLRAGADLPAAVVRFKDDASVPTVIRGFDIDANGKVANGVEMNHSFYAGPLTGAVKRVDNVIVHHVWSRTSLGQYKYGIIVSNSGGASAEVANVEIINSVIHDISRDGLPIYPGDQNANCIVRNVVVRGNIVYNTGQDPDYGAGSGIIVKGRVIGATIENNYVTATKGAGIFVNGNESHHYGFGPLNISIRNNIVNVNTIHGSIRIYDGASGSDPKQVDIYGNIVYGNSLGSGLLLGSDLGNSNSIRVIGNTFYNAPVVISSSSANFPVFDFKNNIIYQSGGIPLIDSGRIISHSNNLYYGSGSLVRSGGTSYTASNLGAYEPTGLSSDPLFVNMAEVPTGFIGTAVNATVPNTTGLALKPASSAIDRGTVLASPFDKGVNGVYRPSGAGWDIGAYESQSNNSIQSPSNLRVVR